MKLRQAMPGSCGGRGGEEAEAGELGGNKGLIVAVDDAGFPAGGGVHSVAKSVQQAGLRNWQANTTGALSIGSNTASSQAVDCDGTGRGTGSPIVGLQALCLRHRLHDTQRSGQNR